MRGGKTVRKSIGNTSTSKWDRLQNRLVGLLTADWLVQLQKSRAQT